MELNVKSEEETLYEGFKVLTQMMARAIAEECFTREESLLKRNNISYSSEVTNDAINEKPKRSAISVTEVSKLLGLSRSVIYEAVHTGQIPSIRIGSRILIPRVALSRFLGEVAR